MKKYLVSYVLADHQFSREIEATSKENALDVLKEMNPGVQHIRAEEMPEVFSAEFSESDLLALSSGLLALIDNAVKADALVTTEAAHNAIKDEIQAYKRLNDRLCNTMEG